MNRHVWSHLIKCLNPILRQKKLILTRCDLKRVGKANETSLQSVTMTTGGATIFRTHFSQTKAVPETASIQNAAVKEISRNECDLLVFVHNFQEINCFCSDGVPSNIRYVLEFVICNFD